MEVKSLYERWLAFPGKSRLKIEFGFFLFTHVSKLKSKREPRQDRLPKHRFDELLRPGQDMSKKPLIRGTFR